MTEIELAAYVDAAAAAMNLPLGDSRPEVLRYFAMAAGFAELVQAAPLEVHDESPMAFVPVSPASPASLVQPAPSGAAT